MDNNDIEEGFSRLGIFEAGHDVKNDHLQKQSKMRS
jgi:hypothetical protein